MPLRAALLALLLALLLVTACGAEPPATCGAPGLVRACACVGGAWSVCVCPDGGPVDAPGLAAPAPDAAPDTGPDARADASPAADADASVDGPRDAAPIGECPRGRDEECPAGGVCLGVACYQGCEDGGACGAGERCVVRMLPTGQVRVCAPE